jgi:rfaE bifunctional protein nucleotidyltransferase chain/domain
VKIALFQFTPDSADIDGNRDKVSNAVRDAAREGASLVLLPELWSTGLLSGEKAPTAAARTPELTEHLVQLSRESGLVIAGSLPEIGEQGDTGDGPVIWNTTFVTDSDGICCRYRKINLFRPMGEHRVFAPGLDPVIFDVPGHDGLRAGLMTCFDLRFPELARELAWHGAGLLLVSALWPMVRRDHFELLLQARAVENQCFCAGTNACGISGNTEFAGASSVIDPVGTVLSRAESNQALIVQQIDLAAIEQVRKRFLSAHPPRHWACHDVKFLSLQELTKIAGARRKAGQRMVFTNGCFDILHAGHVSYLQEARRQGDFLVVGLNSDSSIREIKGPGRPVNPEDMRAAVLSGLGCVDYVTLFSDRTPERLIASILPDVLVKGADWAEDEIVGADIVKANGGRVVRIPFVHDTSTTDTIRRIRQDKDQS